MTQEDKNILLKDLCARLPYGVKVESVPYVDPQILCSIDPIRKEFRLDFGEYRNIFATNWVGEEYSIIKPYLRPMSSMTDEERLYFHRNSARVQILVDEEKLITKPFYGYTIHLFDWLNANHFDYHNLIGKSLALEAPTDMYKTE